jgi:XTP/dITP diphosphohydrolase
VRPRFERLVVATSNPGKLREFEELLKGVAGEIVAQGALGIAAAEETEASFVGNALLKARHAARLAGCAALADDSGLEVDALGGAPGVYSARYAGSDATDAANNLKLLAALEAIPPPRTARYRAVLVLVASATDPSPLIAEGVWEGEIAMVPRGNGGFGYDPLFIVAGTGLTAAEMPLALKNEQSHRAQAMRVLQRRLSP